MTDGAHDPALTESPMFRAGWLAVERGFNDADLVMVEDLEYLDPTGPPIVAVMDAGDLTLPQARTLAALAGAGRPTLIVLSDGELNDAVRPWLGQQIEVVHLSHDEGLDPVVTAESPKEELTPRPDLPPTDGDYCLVTWAGVTVSGGGSSQRGSQYLTHLIESLRLQGVRDGLCFAAQMPTTPAGISSWIEFSSAHSGGRDYMVIETPIGAGIDPAKLWTRDALTAFAWHVVRWCEQPLTQGPTRKSWFRRSSELVDSPVPESACFPGGKGSVQRRLTTSEALVAYRHQPSSLSEPIELGALTPLFFEYWVPLEEWGVFQRWAITAVTSLLRMLHLLQEPGWSDLPGRDQSADGAAVEQLKASLSFSAYGDLAAEAFDERHRRGRSIAIADGSMTEAEFDALDLVESPLSPGPPLNVWPPSQASSSR